MVVAYFSLKGLGAPEWAAIPVSIAVGQFLWSKERTRMERDNQTAWLRQIIMTNALLVEMKLNDVMIKVEKLGRDDGEENGEHEAGEQEAQTKAQLI
jgi:hypothetical protein